MTGPQAVVEHAVAGRARLRLPAMRGRRDYLEPLAEALRAHATVESVEVNPTTGGLLVRHRGGDPAAIWRAAADAGWFTFDGDEPGPDAVLGRLDEGRRNAQEWSLRWLQSRRLHRSAFVGLMSLGVRQMARGQVAAPALTLFWYALNTVGFPVGRAEPEREPGRTEQ